MPSKRAGPTAPADDPEVYALASAGEQQARRRLLADPEIAPLTRLVEEIRAEEGLHGEVPYFDPHDAGARARVLFLLEAPGPKAVESGFISRNNPDPTARNFLLLLKEAMIPRDETLLWNIIPWYIGTGERIRPARHSDIRAGEKYLQRLLALLPELKAIVLVGRKAQAAAKFLSGLTGARVFHTLHPSAQVITCWPEKRVQLLEELRSVRSFLNGGT